MAFGGKDSSEFSWAITYEIQYSLGENVMQTAKVLVWQDYIRRLKIIDEAYWNDYWIERARNANLSLDQIKVGEPVSITEQLVVQCAEKCVQNGIPFSNYGYDFSMNDDLVSDHNKMMGFETKSMNYNRSPEGIDLPHIKENTKDFCYNRRDEILFSAAGAFHSRSIRNGHFIESAIDDLCRTRYQDRGKKRKTESNAEFKERHNGRSPDMLVAMTGNIEMARLRTSLGQKIIAPIERNPIKKMANKYKQRKAMRL